MFSTVELVVANGTVYTLDSTIAPLAPATSSLSTGGSIISGTGGTDVYSGRPGADIFEWSLNDQGTAGSPVTDVVKGFTIAAGDVLDVSDLLVGESDANIQSYLHVVGAGGNTVVHISSFGGYDSGYSADQTDQVINLKGATGLDLTDIQQMFNYNGEV